MGVSRLPAEAIIADYQAGDGIITLAERYGCSRTGIRHLLARAGVPRRPRGGVTRPITSEGIVALRDVDRLSWTDIAAQTGLTEETLRARYRQAAGTLPSREWHRAAGQRPDLAAEQLQQLNAVVDHRDQIASAYLAGQVSSTELAREYGISEKTVRTWAARHREVRSR